jgi:hypothetical protein
MARKVKEGKGGDGHGLAGKEGVLWIVSDWKGKAGMEWTGKEWTGMDGHGLSGRGAAG